MGIRWLWYLPGGGILRRIGKWSRGDWESRSCHFYLLIHPSYSFVLST